jgi:predicted RNA-binding Zn ribbon-like protein
MSVMSDQTAPGELELVRQFVNTLDVEDGTDVLDSPQELEAWLEDRDLPRAKVDESARSRLVSVREALRRLLLANNAGAPAPRAALEQLNRESSAAAIGLRFDREGAALVSGASGVDAVIARLLAVVGESMREGTWQRLKACPADDCLWAFYDHSRNRSGTWCRMEECGNRAKARAYRERHRAKPGTSRSR